MRLTGRVAIVTGAGSGIGQAIAVRLAAEGAAVVAVGQTPARLEHTVERITTNGGSAHAVPCNVAESEQVQRMVRAAVDRHHRVDILVNNAAKNRPDEPVVERAAEMAEAWWSATLDVNVVGAFRPLAAFPARSCLFFKLDLLGFSCLLVP